jgi:hypothetical protein
MVRKGSGVRVPQRALSYCLSPGDWDVGRFGGSRVQTGMETIWEPRRFAEARCCSLTGVSLGATEVVLLRMFLMFVRFLLHCKSSTPRRRRRWKHANVSRATAAQERCRTRRCNSAARRGDCRFLTGGRERGQRRGSSLLITELAHLRTRRTTMASMPERSPDVRRADDSTIAVATAPAGTEPTSAIVALR